MKTWFCFSNFLSGNDVASTSNSLEAAARKESGLFAKEWRGALAYGLLIYGIYRLIVLISTTWFMMKSNGLPTLLSDPILISYGPASIFLGAMFVVHRQVWFPDLQFVGTWGRRDLVIGTTTLSALYFAVTALEYWMGQPREAIMASLYQFKTPPQIVVFVTALLVLPPIVEELAFRHFLLSVLPFRKNRIVAVIAVVTTALYFSHAHGYQHWTTNVEMFVVGVVLAIARIRSNGLLLPVALHAYTISLALVLDQVMRHVGR
ncbi:hypothetical protein WS98_21370 [Burkholderia territorii]|uniref:CPBP family intramembrane glutamic endopeptidase n=1 Tax=Burkholderia territorii TaxID=1503055 RepID=UPI000754103E|nr:type II CAAX endopeptidase family protein [Burkholderia territorii]KVL32097.1 hypothetical protein WS98_21370 [Burkholderia territorii]